MAKYSKLGNLFYVSLSLTFILVCTACEKTSGTTTPVNKNDALDTVSSEKMPDIAPYTLQVMEHEPILSYGEESFQNTSALIELNEDSYSSVILVLTLHTTCFPFEQWNQDPPPVGHRFPPSCDAFDRNFELHLIDQRQLDMGEDVQDAELEVLRAITPFGGPAEHQIDITDIANISSGTLRARVHIPTYSDPEGQISGSRGGWEVSLKVEVTPGKKPRPIIGVYSLFNRTVSYESEDPRIQFIIPEGIQSSRLEYRATGHGGGMDTSPACIGPAEEFCRRTQTILIDGIEVDQITPWRDDCDDQCTLVTHDNVRNSFEYCLENPTGSIQSVRAPRANWCPGSHTPPFTWEMDVLNDAGPHTFEVKLLDLHPQGRWRTSAILYLYGP